MKRDLEQLQLLMIFHFVLAAIVAFLSLFPLLYVFTGIMVLNTPPPPPGTPGAPAPGVYTTLGWTMIAIGGSLALIGFVEAVLLLIGGFCLWKRKGYGFCFTVACITCVVPPLLGTALGVCSILVLVRQSVKDLFAGRIVPSPDPEDEEDEPPRAPRRSEQVDDDRFTWRE